MKKKDQSQECDQSKMLLFAKPGRFRICGSESDELTQLQMVSLVADISAAGLTVSILTFNESDERLSDRFESYQREKNIKRIFIKNCCLHELNEIDTEIRKVKNATKCSVVIINHISDGMLSNELVKRLDGVAKSCKLCIYFFAQLMWLRKYLDAKASRKAESRRVK